MGKKKRAHSTEMQSDIRYRLVIISPWLTYLGYTRAEYLTGYILMHHIQVFKLVLNTVFK